MEALGLVVGHLCGDYVAQSDNMAAGKRQSHLACLQHCAAYTVCVWLFSFWWMPWWGLALCMALHFPVDRYRLVGRWMLAFGQEGFFRGLGPWSFILVDNTYHLVCLWLILAIFQGALSWGMLLPLGLVALVLFANYRQARLDEKDAVAERGDEDADDCDCPDCRPGDDDTVVDDSPAYVYPAGISLEGFDPKANVRVHGARRSDGRRVLIHLRPGVFEDLKLLDPAATQVVEFNEPNPVDPAHAAWYGYAHVLVSYAINRGDTLAPEMAARAARLQQAIQEQLQPGPEPTAEEKNGYADVTVCVAEDTSVHVQYEKLHLVAGNDDDLARLVPGKHIVVAFNAVTPKGGDFDTPWWKALDHLLGLCTPRHVQRPPLLPGLERPALAASGQGETDSHLIFMLHGQRREFALRCVPGDKDAVDAARGFSAEKLTVCGVIRARDAAWAEETLGVVSECLSGGEPDWNKEATYGVPGMSLEPLPSPLAGPAAGPDGAAVCRTDGHDLCFVVDLSPECVRQAFPARVDFSYRLGEAVNDTVERASRRLERRWPDLPAHEKTRLLEVVRGRAVATSGGLHIDVCDRCIDSNRFADDWNDEQPRKAA